MAEFRISKSTGLPPSASAATDLPLATSSTCKDTLLFSLRSCCSSSLFSGLRQVAITSHPSAAYCRANSKPSPRFAPVIKVVDMFCFSCAQKIWLKLSVYRTFCGYLPEVPLGRMPRATFRHKETLLATCEHRVGNLRIKCARTLSNLAHPPLPVAFSAITRGNPSDTEATTIKRGHRQ